MPLGDELLLQAAGREQGGAVQLLPHRARRGGVDVLADQVGQLERPHAEAAERLHRAVDLVGRGVAVLENAERLQVVRPRHVVDDEAGHVGGAGDDLAPALRDGGGTVDHRRVGVRAGDHLDELHERGGVEKVHADGALRRADRLAERTDRQRGGVGRDDRVCGQRRHRALEHALLRIEVLEDGLDQQPAGPEILRAAGDVQPRGRRIAGGGLQAALLDEPIEASTHALDGPLRGGVVDVQQMHVPPGGGRDLRDARAHGAGPDDADGRGHVPLKSGLRFSMNATTPSKWSSVIPAVSCANASASSCWARSCS